MIKLHFVRAKIFSCKSAILMSATARVLLATCWNAVALGNDEKFNTIEELEGKHFFFLYNIYKHFLLSHSLSVFTISMHPYPINTFSLIKFPLNNYIFLYLCFHSIFIFFLLNFIIFYFTANHLHFMFISF